LVNYSRYYRRWAGLLALTAYFQANFAAIEPLHPLILLTLLSFSLTMANGNLLNPAKIQRGFTLGNVGLFYFLLIPLWIP